MYVYTLHHVNSKRHCVTNNVLKHGKCSIFFIAHDKLEEVDLFNPFIYLMIEV